MISPTFSRALEENVCCCVRNAIPGKERVDDGKFETSPVRIGEYILCYGKRQSSFPFHCLIGPDWIMNGTGHESR